MPVTGFPPVKWAAVLYPSGWKEATPIPLITTSTRTMAKLEGKDNKEKPMPAKRHPTGRRKASLGCRKVSKERLNQGRCKVGRHQDYTGHCVGQRQILFQKRQYGRKRPLIDVGYQVTQRKQEQYLQVKLFHFSSPTTYPTSISSIEQQQIFHFLLVTGFSGMLSKTVMSPHLNPSLMPVWEEREDRIRLVDRIDLPAKGLSPAWSISLR